VDSVLAYYRAMLAFRKSQPALVDGSIGFVGDDPEVLAFVREEGDERLLCVFNFAREVVTWKPPETLGIPQPLELPRFHAPAGDAVLPPLGVALFRLPSG
jgi:alpha-glucosidase